MKSLRYALETVLAYLTYGFFRLLPLETASDIGGKIVRALGPRMGISRVALRNINLAFPEKTPAEQARILDGMWENLGRVIAEYPHLRGIGPCIELVGKEHLEKVAREGGPVIFFAGHLANWELCALTAKTRGVDIHLVYRKPNNPGVDSLLRHARDSGAKGHIEKGREGAREIVSVLKKKGVVGMLMDQKLNEGLAIPFFGRPAMTAPAIAQFALRMKCPIYPCRVERTGGCAFKVTVLPPLDISGGADATRILTEINALLEGWIRERPGQWLWLHRRWD